MAEISTVFVVDDDVAVRAAISASLEEHGLQVCSYASADEFLAHYRCDQAGCLVLDVSMPGISGIRLQQMLNKDAYHLPIIFITGHGDVPMAVTALKGGAVDFFEKPYRQDALLACIRRAIANDLLERQRHADWNELIARYRTLTQREREVMAALAADSATASNKQIALTLHISHRTVAEHRAHVMQKMQARSVVDLVAMNNTIHGPRRAASHKLSDF
jgi:two-component system, LuxR family, response regulator FixJ